MRERVNGERTDGFTLVELLIVIVILGVLATVVVFAVSGVTGDGQGSVCATDESTLATAIEAYYAINETNVLPPTGGSNDAYELTLRSAGLIRDVSPHWDIDGSGGLNPQIGSPC